MPDVLDTITGSVADRLELDLEDATGSLRQGDAHAPAGEKSARRSICLYTPSVDPSGMGAHMVDLVAEYVLHADVSLMCWPTVGGCRVLDRAAELGARILALPPPRDPSFAEVIDAFLAEYRPDVFHVHVGLGVEDFDGARVARRAGVPVIVQTQHLPFLLSNPRKRHAFLHAIEPVDRIIAVSEALRRTYERLGVPAERFTTIPNGVRPRGPGLGRSAARDALGLAPDDLVVMTVGRLTRMKGQRYLVDAVPELSSRFPGLAVVILGTGPLSEHLAERAAALGVDGCVRFAGHRGDARALLDAADVFVLPSRHEGMPLAAIEAMDAGLPIVGTRVVGTEEVVADGETGTLVPAEDAPALAAALAELLSDGDLRTRYGEAGRRRYLEHFTATQMAAKTRDAYAQELRARAAGLPRSGA